MTMRDVAELIDEAIFMLGNAMGCTDGIDVKECVEDKQTIDVLNERVYEEVN